MHPTHPALVTLLVSLATTLVACGTTGGARSGAGDRPDAPKKLTARERESRDYYATRLAAVGAAADAALETCAWDDFPGLALEAEGQAHQHRIAPDLHWDWRERAHTLVQPVLDCIDQRAASGDVAGAANLSSMFVSLTAFVGPREPDFRERFERYNSMLAGAAVTSLTDRAEAARTRGHLATATVLLAVIAQGGDEPRIDPEVVTLVRQLDASATTTISFSGPASAADVLADPELPSSLTLVESGATVRVTLRYEEPEVSESEASATRSIEVVTNTSSRPNPKVAALNAEIAKLRAAEESALATVQSTWDNIERVRAQRDADAARKKAADLERQRDREPDPIVTEIKAKRSYPVTEYVTTARGEVEVRIDGAGESRSKRSKVVVPVSEVAHEAQPELGLDAAYGSHPSADEARAAWRRKAVAIALGHVTALGLTPSALALSRARAQPVGSDERVEQIYRACIIDSALCLESEIAAELRKLSLPTNLDAVRAHRHAD